MKSDESTLGKTTSDELIPEEEISDGTSDQPTSDKQTLGKSPPVCTSDDEWGCHGKCDKGQCNCKDGWGGDTCTNKQ